MEEVEMYDAFQLPAPSQSTLEWLSTGSTHEQAPRMGVVQWQQRDTSCAALDKMRRETADQRAFSSGFGYGLKTNSNRNLPTMPSTRMSSPSSTGGPSSRRRPDKSHKGRRSTAREPSSSMKEAAPELELAKLVKSVVSNIDGQAQLKQQHVEKKRRQALAERSASANRALTRNSSARQALSVQRQPLSRIHSEDVLRKQGAPSTSRTKDSLKDMEWVPTLSPPMVRKDSGGDSGFEESFRAETNSGMELPSDTLPITEESLPRARRFTTTQDLMPPPPPKPSKLQTRSLQPKPTPVPAPAPASRDLPCTPPLGVSSSQFIRGQGLPSATQSQSQSHRPPALGMRRTNAYTSTSNTTTFSSSQNLPSKQRGFKPPFARPPTASQLSSTSTSSSNVKASSQMGRGSQPCPTARAPVQAARERSPSPALDPDSSYGEISFDMDIIEETMKQYDEI